MTKQQRMKAELKVVRTLKYWEDADWFRLETKKKIAEMVVAELEDYFARRNPMAFRAQGGRVGMYGGGISDMDLTQGGASFGPGTGTSDDIPAMLSDGEFVVTANAVKNLGGGNRMLGAKRMYQMMNSLDPNSQTPAEMDTTGIA